MCREEAYDLCALLAKRQESQATCPNLFGVVKQQADSAQGDAKLGVQEFADNYFCGPLYLDEERKMYKLLGNRRLKISWSALLTPRKTYSELKKYNERATTKGVTGNLQGEGILQGGVLVVNPEGEIVYAYQEQTGSELPVKAIDQAIHEMVGR